MSKGFSGLKILKPNTIEMTADQLLDVTESLVREYYKLGRCKSSRPTEEDIWAMLAALNFTVWLCPAIGHEAIKLLHQKYEKV
jgi:hypothetical protein